MNSGIVLDPREALSEAMSSYRRRSSRFSPSSNGLPLPQFSPIFRMPRDSLL